MNIEQFQQLVPLPESWTAPAFLLFFVLTPFVFRSITPVTRLCSTWNEARNRKILTERLSLGSYDKETIRQSTKYYINPKCSNIDPAQEEEIRQALMATRESLFDKIDYFIDHDSSKRHLLILADSGTGKTSFMLNYYAYNLRRRGRKSQNLFLVHLGLKDADNQIQEHKDKNETIIFLDALDEDTKAIEDHRKRIVDLMEICRDFKRVIITCRTQFFPNDEEMPVETGIARLGPRKAGEKGIYEFWKLYLSPFDDRDINLYLQKRFPFWRFRDRTKAVELAYRIKSLSARPMLLAHIPDVIDSEASITLSYQLYQLMIDAWLERESSWVCKSDLREYSERLAVNLYVNRETRGMERVPFNDLEELAYEWNIDLPQWQLSGRSLLNRDAQGNYKFAHRSIMEFLFVNRLFKRDIDCSGVVLTDQMKSFLIERISLKSENRAFNKALQFLFRAEVFVDFDDRPTLERNDSSNVNHIIASDDFEGASSCADFLASLHQTSKHVFFLYQMNHIHSLFPRALEDDPSQLNAIDGGDLLDFLMSVKGIQIKQESGIDYLSFDPSDAYINHIAELVSPRFSKDTYVPTVHRLRILQQYSIEVRNALQAVTDSNSQSEGQAQRESSLPTELHHGVKRFIDIYGIRGLISYYLINKSNCCAIEPKLPSLHQFSFRLALDT